MKKPDVIEHIAQYLLVNNNKYGSCGEEKAIIGPKTVVERQKTAKLVLDCLDDLGLLSKKALNDEVNSND